MIIRDMRRDDIDVVVGIHEQAFNGFFLTRMGPRFLRAYYQTVLDFDQSIAIVAQEAENEDVFGFAVGFRDPQEFYALFARRRKRMVPAIALAVLRDPGLIPQILRNMRRVETQAQNAVDAVELSSIAVNAPSKGVGGELLEAFVEKARAQAAGKITLTTDAEGNDAVRGFYERRGFFLEGIEMRGERKLCCYVREVG